MTWPFKYINLKLAVGHIIFCIFNFYMEEQVILVDTADNQLGLMPKMEAHEKGVLHRAFSVFVLNEKGELMLQ